MLDVKNIDRGSTLRLGCEEGVGQAATLQIGQQTTHWDLQQLSPDQLFVSFDTSSLPAGCTMQAVLTNVKEGASAPVTLAHIVRVPQVEVVNTSVEPAAPGHVTLTLKGRGLEMIDKVAWDANSGVSPAGLPTPLPGEGQKQSLQITLPAPPSPDAPLYLWLRGEKAGRETTLKLPSSNPDTVPANSHPLPSSKQTNLSR